MHIVIGLLILIILLLIFGPWLLLAIGIVIAALIAAIAWVVKALIVPVGIALLVGLALVLLGFVVLVAWGGIDHAMARFTGLRRDKHSSTHPLPRFTKSGRYPAPSVSLEEQRRVYEGAIRSPKAEGHHQGSRASNAPPGEPLER